MLAIEKKLYAVVLFYIKYLEIGIPALIYSNSGDNGMDSEDGSDNEDGIESASRSVPGW